MTYSPLTGFSVLYVMYFENVSNYNCRFFTFADRQKEIWIPRMKLELIDGIPMTYVMLDLGGGKVVNCRHDLDLLSAMKITSIIL